MNDNWLVSMTDYFIVFSWCEWQLNVSEQELQQLLIITMLSIEIEAEKFKLNIFSATRRVDEQSY